MGNQVSRIDVVGQNGNDGLHYLEDAGDEQQHVDTRIEPADQRPAAAHYWSPGAPGYVSGWYKIAHDGKWWFWRAKDGRDWLHAPPPEQAIINNLVALPPLDTATHTAGNTYYRLSQDGWSRWASRSKQWVYCPTPNPASVDRVIHPRVTLNQPEIPDSSDHIADASKMVEGDPTALEAKRQQLGPDHSGEATEKPSMAELYPKYYKDFTGVNEADVYLVHDRFQINDPSGCIHHASKKLLLCGVRTGGKPEWQEIKEARDTLTRKLQLMGVE